MINAFAKIGGDYQKKWGGEEGIEDEEGEIENESRERGERKKTEDRIDTDRYRYGIRVNNASIWHFDYRDQTRFSTPSAHRCARSY